MSTISLDSLTSAYSTTSAASSASTSASSLSSLTGEDFLNLLLLELQNQDPTDPASISDMTSTLCDLTQMEQSETTNEYLESLAQYASSQAVNYLGKTISFSNDEISVSGGTAGSASFELGSDASKVCATTYNSSGKAVKTIDLGSMSAGSHSYKWDCTDNDGATVSDGTYTVSYSAADSNGNSVSVTTGGTAEVTGILYKDGVPYLVTDLGEVSITSVTQVT